MCGEKSPPRIWLADEKRHVGAVVDFQGLGFRV